MFETNLSIFFLTTKKKREKMRKKFTFFLFNTFHGNETAVFSCFFNQV